MRRFLGDKTQVQSYVKVKFEVKNELWNVRLLFT